MVPTTYQGNQETPLIQSSCALHPHLFFFSERNIRSFGWEDEDVWGGKGGTGEFLGFNLLVSYFSARKKPTYPLRKGIMLKGNESSEHILKQPLIFGGTVVTLKGPD